MARQIGDITITGTIGGVTFYQMEGRYYARRKSSLTGKKVKRDPRFKRTMESANRMSRGAQMASGVYRHLPKAERVKGLFRELVSMAVLALKKGKEEDAVRELLELRVKKEKRRTVIDDAKGACRSTIRLRSVICKKLFSLPDKWSGRGLLVRENLTKTRRSDKVLPNRIMLVLRE